MRKKVCSLLILILCMMPLCGCRVYDGKDHDLYQQIKSNVLCTNTEHPGQSILLEIMDEDRYGRRLFQYFMYVTDLCEYKQVSVIAVSQKTESDWVYYYEDINFIMAETFEEIDKDQIETLKKENGWNQPLETQKMSRRKLYASHIHIDNVLLKFRDEIVTEPGSELGASFSDTDGVGKVLYYCIVYDMDRNDDIHIDERTYIAIINEDGTYDADTWIAELEDLYGYQEQLHALKLANGWTFGPG